MSYIAERVHELSRNANHPVENGVFAKRKLSPPNTKTWGVKTYKDIRNEKKQLQAELEKEKIPGYMQSKKTRLTPMYKSQNVTAADESILKMMEDLKKKSIQKEKELAKINRWK